MNKELMNYSTHPDAQHGLTMDEMIDSVNRSFIPERKSDMKYLKSMEAQYSLATYPNGFGLYIQAVRAYVEKWRVPDEEQQVDMIKAYESAHK